LVYGTIVALGAEANLLFKPYGYTDIQIGICAITMLVMGVVGSIVFSIYLKKTGNYRRALRTIVVISFFIIVGLELWLSLSAKLALTIVIVGLVGFCCTPIIPLCYDLGCELAFPMGEAQVTGILNGASLFFTFITTLIISSAIGFGEKSDSTIVMFAFMSFVLVGCFLFFRVKIILKRKNLESGKL
jgi:FLVCR family feline leukemia virus subgroup C receptor-related protein